jgi:protein phosphatase
MSDIDIIKINQLGDIPSARFGHTFTLISKNRAILFGGAIGDSGKFIITNETYLYDFTTRVWRKVET